MVNPNKFDFENQYNKEKRWFDSEQKLLKHFRDKKPKPELYFSREEYKTSPKVIKDEGRDAKSRTDENSIVFKFDNVKKELESLNLTIDESTFKHQFIEYRSLELNLTKLFNYLDMFDIDNDPDLRKLRKVHYEKIHQLEEKLKTKLECKINDCIICRTGIDLEA